MKIKATIERFPGGMMIIPLALGCLLANLAPDAPKFFGSFTGALFTGALPILAVFYVCMGATISLETTPYLLRKGGVLLGVKILCGIIAGLVMGHFLGEKPVAGGFFCGAFRAGRCRGHQRHQRRPLHGADGAIRQTS